VGLIKVGSFGMVDGGKGVNWEAIVGRGCYWAWVYFSGRFYGVYGVEFS